MLRDGLLCAKNVTDREQVDGYIYYMRFHNDGNYLGGITDQAGVGGLAPGSTIEVTAEHTPEQNAAVCCGSHKIRVYIL